MSNNSQYIQNVLSRRNGVINASTAQSAADKVLPVIRNWGGKSINDISLSGSYAKGTAVQGGTDIDLFISLLSTTSESLGDIYNTLYNAMTSDGFATARKQNVSIGLTVDGFKIDLVPGKRQGVYGSDHSLYKNKTGTWTKTNIKTHIDLVKGCGRLSEIRAMKIWRNNKGLDFPSFYLELSVIEALKGTTLVSSGNGDLSKNIVRVLQYLESDFKTARFVDPANANNVISADMTQQGKINIAQAAARSLKGQWEDFIS
jgi:hypothetical protein